MMCLRDLAVVVVAVAVSRTQIRIPALLQIPAARRPAKLPIRGQFNETLYLDIFYSFADTVIADKGGAFMGALDEHVTAQE